MESDFLEEGALEEAHDSSMGLHIPDDARAVRAAAQRLFVVSSQLKLHAHYLYAPDAVSVLLHRGLHALRLPSNPPDSDFSFHTT